MYVKFFVHKFLRDIQSVHFVFKISILEKQNLYSRLLLHENLPISRLLTGVFVHVNGIVFNRSNGLTIKCLIGC